MTTTTPSTFPTHPPQLNSGTWTSFLPLTTTFPSPPACSTQIWARNGVNPSALAWPYIYDVAYELSVANTVTCLPSEVSQWWSGAATILNTVTVWSLGPVVCPAPFTTASTSVLVGGSTSVFCCPTGYNIAHSLPLDPGLDGVCTSAFSSGQKLVYASPTSNGYTSVTTTISVKTGYMVANPVEGYNFAVTSTSASSSLSSASSSTISTTPTLTSTPTNEVSGGLSTGAKAGIGAGVAVLLVVLVAIAGFLLRRRRRKCLPGFAHEMPVYGYHQGHKHEMISGASSDGMLAEADSDATMTRPMEMDGRAKPVELAG